METQRQSLPEGPKARRVYLSLRDEIANRLHAPGDTLPGEEKLARDFEVSRVTVRRALDALSQEGLVEKRAGCGTVVLPSANPDKPVSMDFTTLMPQVAEMGNTTTARLLSFTYGIPPEQVAEALELAADTRVQIATRVRLADNQPFSHLTTYVPEAIASHYSESDLASTPLFVLLERGGATIGRATQSVSATLASPAVASALNVVVGTALLSLRRVVCDGNGAGIEYLSALYRPDLFRLDMELSRVGDGSSRHWAPTIQGRGEISPAKISPTKGKRTKQADGA